MMLRTMNSVLALAGGLLVSTAAWSAGPSGALLAGTCAGCHGTNGASVGPASPTIAGMTVDTFTESMKGFQKKAGDEGYRPATIMDRIAKGYTDDEIKAMAEYFAKQKFVRVQQPAVDAAKAKEGKKLHDDYCEKCHTDEGRKDEDGSSVLAGQWLQYLQFTAEDFHSGAREMPKKMKSRIEAMGREAGADGLDKVMHFYASQK